MNEQKEPCEVDNCPGEFHSLGRISQESRELMSMYPMLIDVTHECFRRLPVTGVIVKTESIKDMDGKERVAYLVRTYQGHEFRYSYFDKTTGEYLGDTLR